MLAQQAVALPSPEWSLAPIDPKQVQRLAFELGLLEPTAEVLVRRGLGEAAAAGRFLAPRLADLRNPVGMAGFGPAVERLAGIVLGGEAVGVFGDYDVDGVTTAALLTTFLRQAGAQVVVRVARREAGYGFGVEDAQAFADAGCRAIVIGDCGTSDHEAVGVAQGRGVDVIIVDHHQVPETESPAFALINPHQGQCQFPFKGLASVGVAFYLAAALRTRLLAAAPERSWPDPRGLLDLVAVGTICDLAPLTLENRILVSTGLRLLAEQPRPGLEVLAEMAKGGRSGSAFDVGFRLGPRLNAPGRLGDARPALDLLLATDDDEARRVATLLGEANTKRQAIQERVLAESIAMVEAGEAGRHAILVAKQGWHPGVVGIVAAKLAERYRRPAMVLAGEGPLFRGSVRSIEGFHAQRALALMGDLLVRYGGHQAAAGLTVSEEQLGGVRRSWEEVAERIFGQAERGSKETLVVDAEVTMEQVEERLAQEVARLGPFGVGNAEPIFVTDAAVVRSRIVGENHLQLGLRGERGRELKAIGFRMAAQDPGVGARVRIAFVPELDEWRGQKRLQLRLRALRPHAV